MHREIYRRFDEADIVIVFPQREAHFESEQPIRIVIDTPPDN
jgi:small-conductance mechanosensitive channel